MSGADVLRNVPPEKTPRFEIRKRLAIITGRAVAIATAEDFLKWYPGRNGGVMIAARTCAMAFLVYSAAFAVEAATAPGADWWSFNFEELLALIHSTFPWFGAIAGSIYLALYSRFASQWAYLSGVYNSIKQAELTHGKGSCCCRTEALAEWKAAFIEDCLALHLAGRPSFGATIQAWSEEPAIREKFIAHSVDGENQWAKVLNASSRCRPPKAPSISPAQLSE